MRRNVPLTLGAYLFVTSAALAQADKPAGVREIKRASVSAGELEYEIQGEGEPVLLIHGAHIAASYVPLMSEPALANYRLIRYHRRGFAGSTKHDGPFSMQDQAADALALLKHLGIERAHIVGHSYGGTIAVQLTLDAPEVVHSLVLLEPAMMFVPSAKEFAKETMEPAIARYRAGDRPGAVDAFMQDVVAPNWKTELVRTVPGGPEQAERDARTFFEVEVPALEQWEFDENKAQKFSPPILNVVGTKTVAVAREAGDLIREWFPNTEDYLVQDATHAL